MYIGRRQRKAIAPWKWRTPPYRFLVFVFYDGGSEDVGKNGRVECNRKWVPTRWKVYEIGDRSFCCCVVVLFVLFLLPIEKLESWFQQMLKIVASWIVRWCARFLDIATKVLCYSVCVAIMLIRLWYYVDVVSFWYQSKILNTLQSLHPYMHVHWKAIAKSHRAMQMKDPSLYFPRIPILSEDVVIIPPAGVNV